MRVCPAILQFVAGGFTAAGVGIGGKYETLSIRLEGAHDRLYGAEAFLTTYDDHIPLQQQLVALRLGQLPPRSKVSTAVQNAVRANLNGFGWQALYYPRGRRLIFNIPNPDGSFSQHVQNTALQSQPWCRFVNMNAYCWGLFRDNLYFGAAGGAVYQADTGSLDNFGAVAANAQQAWSTFASPVRKRVTAVRPMVRAELQFRARVRLRRHQHRGRLDDRRHRLAVGYIGLGHVAVVARQRRRSALAGRRGQRPGGRRAHDRGGQRAAMLVADGFPVRAGGGTLSGPRPPDTVPNRHSSKRRCCLVPPI